jgi:hypothetical protein
MDPSASNVLTKWFPCNALAIVFRYLFSLLAGKQLILNLYKQYRIEYLLNFS